LLEEEMNKIITTAAIAVLALATIMIGVVHAVHAAYKPVYYWKGCIGSLCYEEQCDPNNEDCPPKIFGPG